MRHKVYGKHLGRNKNQRTALFKSLVQSLLNNEQIETTEAKAKAIKALVDKIITQAKSPTSKRLVSQFLTQKETQEKLFKDLLPRLGTRKSGFTSVVKLGRRLGDGAMVVKMSLLVEEPKKVATPKAKKAEVKEVKATAVKKAAASKKGQVK